MKAISGLISRIEQVCKYSRDLAQQQVNRSMTMRNWMIGWYIVEFEQQGKIKAAYGAKLFPSLAAKLKAKGLKGMDERSRRSFREFYLAYPPIRGAVSPEFSNSKIKALPIRGAVPPKFNSKAVPAKSKARAEALLSKLSFSHFIELLAVDDIRAREFYENQCMENNWSTRELQRAIQTLLYQRTGLSTAKSRVIKSVKAKGATTQESAFKSPYILDFLGLEQKSEFTENDLEQSIINHLQKFLVELGRGFCFEARQKRITFDNQHYYIDLVFYHRILKCHILIDLKIGAFDHADAGQMNLYLNYFKEEEMAPGDAPPIGIVLCAHKNETLVKYATGGLSQKIFVGKYLVKLPSEKELKKLIEADTRAYLRNKK